MTHSSSQPGLESSAIPAFNPVLERAQNARTSAWKLCESAKASMNAFKNSYEAVEKVTALVERIVALQQAGLEKENVSEFIDIIQSLDLKWLTRLLDYLLHQLLEAIDEGSGEEHRHFKTVKEVSEQVRNGSGIVNEHRGLPAQAGSSFTQTVTSSVVDRPAPILADSPTFPSISTIPSPSSSSQSPSCTARPSLPPRYRSAISAPEMNDQQALIPIEEQESGSQKILMGNSLGRASENNFQDRAGPSFELDDASTLSSIDPLSPLLHSCQNIDTNLTTYPKSEPSSPTLIYPDAGFGTNAGAEPRVQGVGIVSKLVNSKHAVNEGNETDKFEIKTEQEDLLSLTRSSIPPPISESATPMAPPSRVVSATTLDVVPTPAVSGITFTVAEVAPVLTQSVREAATVVAPPTTTVIDTVTSPTVSGSILGDFRQPLMHPLSLEAPIPIPIPNILTSNSDSGSITPLCLNQRPVQNKDILVVSTARSLRTPVSRNLPTRTGTETQKSCPTASVIQTGVVTTTTSNSNVCVAPVPVSPTSTSPQPQVVTRTRTLSHAPPFSHAFRSQTPSNVVGDERRTQVSPYIPVHLPSSLPPGPNPIQHHGCSSASVRPGLQSLPSPLTTSMDGHLSLSTSTKRYNTGTGPDSLLGMKQKQHSVDSGDNGDLNPRTGTRKQSRIIFETESNNSTNDSSTPSPPFSTNAIAAETGAHISSPSSTFSPSSFHHLPTSSYFPLPPCASDLPAHPSFLSTPTPPSYHEPCVNQSASLESRLSSPPLLEHWETYSAIRAQADLTTYHHQSGSETSPYPIDVGISQPNRSQGSGQKRRRDSKQGHEGRHNRPIAMHESKNGNEDEATTPCKRRLIERVRPRKISYR